MSICTHHPPSSEGNEASSAPTNWTAATLQYPNVEELPSFIARSKEAAQPHSVRHHVNPALLQGKRLVYNTVHRHLQTADTEPLRMIISGTAGTGKSYLIHCLRGLLQDQVRVAAFNVEGVTLHSFLHLPTHGDFKNLEGEKLHHLQQNLMGVHYIIVDEVSMVGRKLLGQVDQRLRQAFPYRAQEVLGGCSCLLVGDFGQLPPVMDLPIYTCLSKSAISDLGRTTYQMFSSGVTLTQVMRQNGHNNDQVCFRELLLHMRDGTVTTEDWELLMTRCLSRVPNDFTDALHLHPTVQAVTEHNLAKLQGSGQPIAIIKAVHGGPNASKASSDDASGLDPVINLAHGTRVMLNSNLWVDTGLVNGAMGTVKAICYQSGGPPDLPVAVIVKFDCYSGPALHDCSVPIVPLRRTWLHSGTACSRLQLPLKLAWAVTIHKTQGLTLDKVVIDIGKKEFSAGLTFVAYSRVRHLSDLAFARAFDYQRLSNLANSQQPTPDTAQARGYQTMPHGRSHTPINSTIHWIPIYHNCFTTTI